MPATDTLLKVQKKIESFSSSRRRWLSPTHRLCRGRDGCAVLLLLVVTIISSSCALFLLLRRYQRPGFSQVRPEVLENMSDKVDATSSFAASHMGNRRRGAAESPASEAAAAAASRGQGIDLLCAAAAGTQQRKCHGGETDSVRSTRSSSSGGCSVVEMGPMMTKVQQPVPFFGQNDATSMREMASHLDHLLEEYGKDLVRVVQVCVCV